MLLINEHYPRPCCAQYVHQMSEQRRPQNSEKKQIAGGRASFKSLPRDLPYGLIISAAATLTVFGILIALLDGWAS
jgi:hypothetical protein